MSRPWQWWSTRSPRSRPVTTPGVSPRPRVVSSRIPRAPGADTSGRPEESRCHPRSRPPPGAWASRGHRPPSAPDPQQLSDESRDDAPRAPRAARRAARGRSSRSRTTFVDNSGSPGSSRCRWPGCRSWRRGGSGFSTAFDYFRFDDWVAAPPGGTGPVGDQRIVPDLSRVVVLAAQPGWAWAPGERFPGRRRRRARQPAAAAPPGRRARRAGPGRQGRAGDRVGDLRAGTATRSPRGRAARPTGCPGWSTPRRTPATC